MSDHPNEDLDELDPDEARTPWWMPLLGGALFLLAVLVALVSSDDTTENTAEGDLPSERTPSHDHHDHAGHDHDH